MRLQTEYQHKIVNGLEAANVLINQNIRSNKDRINKHRLRITSASTSQPVKMAINSEIHRLQGLNKTLLEAMTINVKMRSNIKSHFAHVNHERQYNLLLDSTKLMDAAKLLEKKDQEIKALQLQLNELSKQL